MKRFTISDDTYESRILIPQKDIIICERTQVYTRSRHVETFGPSWCLAISDQSDCRIRSGNQWISLKSPFAIFIPAYTIFELEILPGIRSWTLLMCLDDKIQTPNKILFLQGPVKCPISKVEIEEALKLMVTSGEVAKEEKMVSHVASVFKDQLVKSYRNSTKIQDLCVELGYCRRVVSRAFMRTYGLSAVDFRHRIRIFAVFRLLCKGLSITSALAELNISEPKQFLIQFKKFTGKTPSECKIPSGSAKAKFSSCQESLLPESKALQY